MFNLFKKSNAVFSDAEQGILYPPYLKSAVDKKEIERTFTRLFLTDDGQKVLSYLQLITFHRAMGAEADDAQLRYLEGQRALVTTILRLVNNGRQ